jgi:F-type H+-transporting ATPase subunit b
MMPLEFHSAMVLLAAGDAGGKPNPLVLSVDLALWSLFVFLGLLFVLHRYAWKPILEGLDKREKMIADDIDGAKSAHEAAQAKLREYDAKLAGASAEAAAIIAEAKKDAIAAKERIMADAAEEAKRTRDRALADIEAAKDAVVRELAESSVDSAVSLAGSIVGRSLNKNDHQELIQKSIQQFSSGA